MSREGDAHSGQVVCNEMYGSKMELSLPCTLVSYRLVDQKPSCALEWERSELVPGDRVRVGGYISPTEDFERTVAGRVVNKGIRAFVDVVLRMHRHATSSYEKKSCIAVHDEGGRVLCCFPEKSLVHAGSRGLCRAKKSYGWQVPVAPLQAELLPANPGPGCSSQWPRLRVVASGPEECEGKEPRQRGGGVQNKGEEEEERDLGRCMIRSLGEPGDKFAVKRKALLKHGCCVEAPKRPCPWAGTGDAGQFTYKKRLVAVPKQGADRDSLVVRQVWDPAQVLAVGSGSLTAGGSEWVSGSRDPAWAQKHAVGTLDPASQWACYTKRSPPNFDPRSSVPFSSSQPFFA